MSWSKGSELEQAGRLERAGSKLGVSWSKLEQAGSKLGVSWSKWTELEQGD